MERGQREGVGRRGWGGSSRIHRSIWVALNAPLPLPRLLQGLHHGSCSRGHVQAPLAALAVCLPVPLTVTTIQLISDTAPIPDPLFPVILIPSSHLLLQLNAFCYTQHHLTYLPSPTHPYTSHPPHPFLSPAASALDTP